MGDVSWGTVLIVAITQVATLIGILVTNRHALGLERMKIDEARVNERTTRMLDTIGTARLMREEIEQAQAALREAQHHDMKWVSAGAPTTDVWWEEGRVIARVASVEQWAALGLGYNRVEAFERCERATKADPTGPLAWTSKASRAAYAAEGVGRTQDAITALDEIISTVDAALSDGRASKGL